MKKMIFISATLIFAFSCSKDDTPSGQNGSSESDNNLPGMEIRLVPVNPTRGDVISADYYYSVPGVDSIYNLWVVEEETIGMASKTLQTSQIPVGAKIKTVVYVVFQDGKIRIFESEVLILLSPSSASIAAARIGPDSVTVSDVLRITRIEIVGDRSNFSFSCKWYKNGVTIPGAEDSVISLSGFKRGDELTLELTDGNGVKYSTNSVIISNSPPSITSSPPVVTGGGTYTYQIAAFDIDGDILTYSLTQSPSEMTVDRNGIISWLTPSEGTFPVTVEVLDGNGGKTAQSFSLKFSTVSEP
ncbi:hypothetical protein JXA84_07170 [candidate division WOR-3 bacterium]|nr:hypothetical protein [candidate division WOR-3 bacterium]